MRVEEAYSSDPTCLERLHVEVLPPVPFTQTIRWMSKGVFNPILSRPTFTHLRLVTPRFFETPAASTAPLFGLDESYVTEIYGEGARELVLPTEDAPDKIEDLLSRPKHYAEIVTEIREHLARKHSHAARLRELIEIIDA